MEEQNTVSWELDYSQEMDIVIQPATKDASVRTWKRQFVTAISLVIFWVGLNTLKRSSKRLMFSKK